MRRGDEAIIALGSVCESADDARSDCWLEQTSKQSDVDRVERKYKLHSRRHGTVKSRVQVAKLAA